MLALCGALALTGCQSPLYSGMPDDNRYGAAPDYEDRSYVGGEPEASDAEAPAEADNDSRYQYRGGRDPVTGRAATQM